MNNAPRVFMTGISSFTGAAFATEMVRQGFEVVAPLTRARSDYDPLRGKRLNSLPSSIQLIENAPLGSKKLFQELVGRGPLDAVLIHHAVVSGYRSDSFDVSSAISAAIEGAAELTDSLANLGARCAVMTRSVFEAGQGLTDHHGPIGAYAVAKTATVESWRIEFEERGILTADFTITNPVGAGEEKRFVAYLTRSWQANEVPVLQSPHLVRDNVPIDLLAQAYASHVKGVLSGDTHSGCPSFWVGTNLTFAEIVAREFSQRSGCASYPIEVAEKINKSEPRVRIGLDEIQPAESWSEKRFWDEYFAHYFDDHHSS